MNLIESKSLLAKLMATENLTVQQRNVRTASFDVKNRILTVPCLDEKISAELYDLFMGHEVGHALYTPMDGMLKAIDKNMNMSILNVLEDSRIERKIKNKYPGLKSSFLKGYKDLLNRDFFETRYKNLNTMNFIDRLNLFCKGGVSLNIQFNDIEKNLIDEIEKTETYEDVLEVYKKVVDYMKIEEEQRQTRSIKVAQNNDEDEEEYEEDEQYEEEFDEYGDEETEESLEEQFDEGEMFDKKSHGKGGAITEKNLKSQTDEAFRRNENQLFANKDTETLYMNVPKVDITKCIYDYKKLYARYKLEERAAYDYTGFHEYRKESNKVVSYLVKEFELRKNADQMKRASISKTGELNMDKIFSYRFNEDIFKKATIVPGGKSHGLVMFIDWSGSMSNHLGHTIKQLLNLVLFCKKVNIPFEVYAFSDGSYFGTPYRQSPKAGDCYMNQFILLNLLSSRMSASEFTTAGAALMFIGRQPGYVPEWLCLAGTPLNEAVIASMEIVPHFQKKYKLQNVNTVFLTDGDGASITNYYDPNLRLRDTYYDYMTNKRIGEVVFIDPATKQQSKFSNCRNSFSMTNALVRLLKHRTGSHVVGFYVAHARELMTKMHDLFRNTQDYTVVEKIKHDFRKDKFIISTVTGFDDYYVLRSNALDTEEDAELVVKENATTRGLVTAFSKFASSRVNNRVILNRFIGLIA